MWRDDRRAIACWTVAAALLAVAVLLIVNQRNMRVFEAWVSAGVVSGVNLADAHTIRTAVVFPLRGGFVGYALSAGCSAAILVSPFFLLSGGLIVSRRTSIKRGLTTLGFLVVLLFAVNQLRLAIMALSMRLWGFRVGFERSHVFLGTVVSTLGLLAGLFLFIRAMVPKSPPEPVHG